MDKKCTNFVRDTVEVCRNCKASGEILVDTFTEYYIEKCPVCGGSGLIKKHIEGSVTVEAYERPKKQ